MTKSKNNGIRKKIKVVGITGIIMSIIKAKVFCGGMVNFMNLSISFVIPASIKFAIPYMVILGAINYAKTIRALFYVSVFIFVIDTAISASGILDIYASSYTSSWYTGWYLWLFPTFSSVIIFPTGMIIMSLIMGEDQTKD